MCSCCNRKTTSTVDMINIDRQPIPTVWSHKIEIFFFTEESSCDFEVNFYKYKKKIIFLDPILWDQKLGLSCLSILIMSTLYMLYMYSEHISKFL